MLSSMYVLNLYRRIIVSSDGIEPFDWSRQVGLGRRGLFDDIFRGFDERMNSIIITDKTSIDAVNHDTHYTHEIPTYMVPITARGLVTKIS